MFYKDEWLSFHFDKNVYGLKLNNINQEDLLQKWKDFNNTHIDENYFIYTKIKASEVKILHCVESLGFNLVDTNLEFLLKNPAINNKYKIKVGFAKKSYKKKIGKIARDNFTFSRFHLDSNINNKLANYSKAII